MEENWIGTRFDVSKEEDRIKYSECAAWCNETQSGTIAPVEGEENIFECIEIPPLSPSEQIKLEVDTLKKYLADTDYAVIKCYDRGLNFAEEYPELYTARQQARDRINELENGGQND